MSETVKIIHTADLHLGAEMSYLGSAADERRAELLLTFEKIIDLCNNKNADLLLIAGDLFENNSVGSKYISRVLQMIESLKNTTVVFAAGNHDPLTSDSPFLNSDLPDNLIVLDTHDQRVPIKNLPVTIYGKSFGSCYMESDDDFSINADTDNINIMVMHADISGTAGGYNCISSDYIANSNMDYIALGHIHKYSKISVLGKTKFAYCGCPEPHGFDELGDKGVIYAEISKNNFNAQFINTCRRRHIECKVDISGIDTVGAISEKILSELKEKYGENFADNLYKIILCGEISDGVTVDIPEIKKRISDTVFYAKIKDKTRPFYDLTALSRENSLKGKFVKLMLEKAANADAEQKDIIQNALDLGLKAFETEVKYYED